MTAIGEPSQLLSLTRSRCFQKQSNDDTPPETVRSALSFPTRSFLADSILIFLRANQVSVEPSVFSCAKCHFSNSSHWPSTDDHQIHQLHLFSVQDRTRVTISNCSSMSLLSCNLNINIGVVSPYFPSARRNPLGYADGTTIESGPICTVHVNTPNEDVLLLFGCCTKAGRGRGGSGGRGG